MVNTSGEWWSLDPGDGTGEVSLHQEQWSVATVGGSRYDVPPRRGDNIVLPYRPGAIHRPKTPDQRRVSLVMWVSADADDGTGDCEQSFNDNWDELRRLVWTYSGRQVRLVRRWRLSSYTGTGAPLLVADALAELAGPMELHMTGRTRADFVMDFLLADPYFFGAERRVVIPSGSTVTVVNPGHDLAAYRHVTVDLSGPGQLTNYGPEPNVWVRYEGTGPVHLDVSNFLATSGTRSVIGKVKHSGARYWMGLLPTRGGFVNTLTASGCTATLTYRPPYI